MKIANLAGRAVLVTDEGAVDVETASGGKYGPDPQGLFDDWAGFRSWAATASTDEAHASDGAAIGPSQLGAPRPPAFGPKMSIRSYASF